MGPNFSRQLILSEIVFLLFDRSATPQVRLKMNDKKPSRFQFDFSGVLEAFYWSENKQLT